MGKTVRTSVSISVDLRQKMDDHKGRVNWSRVASRSFSREIRRLEGDPGLHGTIQRLREEKKAGSDIYYRDGYSTGSNWIRDNARYDQIKQMECVLVYYRGTYSSRIETVYDQIAPYPTLEYEFKRGFVEGVRDGWIKIKDSVERG